MEIQPASLNSEFSDRHDLDNSFKAKPTNAGVGWLMLHYMDEYGRVSSYKWSYNLYEWPYVTGYWGYNPIYRSYNPSYNW